MYCRSSEPVRRHCCKEKCPKIRVSRSAVKIEGADASHRYHACGCHSGVVWLSSPLSTWTRCESFTLHAPDALAVAEFSFRWRSLAPCFYQPPKYWRLRLRGYIDTFSLCNLLDCLKTAGRTQNEREDQSEGSKGNLQIL